MQLRTTVRKEQARTFNMHGKPCKDTELALTPLIQTRHSSAMTVFLKGLPSWGLTMLNSFVVVVVV